MGGGRQVLGLTSRARSPKRYLGGVPTQNHRRLAILIRPRSRRPLAASHGTEAVAEAAAGTEAVGRGVKVERGRNTFF